MALKHYIAHIRMRAAQDNAQNVWAWAGRRILARLSNDVFIFCWHVFFAWLPSIPGRQIRRLVLRLVLKECGHHLSVSENVHIEYPRRIRLGNNVWIGRNSHLSAPGGIDIGDDCMLAHSTIIESAGHAIEPGTLYHEAKIIYGPVKIGRNTWCGTRTIILYNTTIGNNVVVAAGAVVTKDVPDNCIVGGVPAKLIRQIEWPDSSLESASDAY